MAVINDKKWEVLFIGPTESINTQSIWHAAALERSRGYEKNILIIDWPKDPIVCCGYHQIIENVVDMQYCNEHGIPIVRRAVGGGAVLLDSNQIFYNFIWHVDTPSIPKNIQEIYKYFLKPVVKTYRDFGIKAEYSPVNDILVNHKKISGNGAGQFDLAQVLVGNFILDFPRKEMVKILRLPDEKFRDKVYKSLKDGISSFKDELGYIPSRQEIITCFKENISEIFNIELINGKPSEQLIARMKQLNNQYQTDEWLFGVNHRGKKLIDSVKIHGTLNVSRGIYKSKGGLIEVICEFQGSMLRDILISGDFWIIPQTKLPVLEDLLKEKDINRDNLEEIINNFLGENDCQTPGTNANDLVQAIKTAYRNLKN